MSSLKYTCGTEVRFDDIVKFDGERIVVDDVIDDIPSQCRWMVSERGIGYRDEIEGRVFVPEKSEYWSKIVFVSREPT